MSNVDVKIFFIQTQVKRSMKNFKFYSLFLRFLNRKEYTMKFAKATLFILAVMLLHFGCKPAFDHQITVSELESTLSFMASDSLKGRLPGTPEDSVLTAYITTRMDLSGMALMGENGTQEVKVERGAIVTENNMVTLRGKTERLVNNSDLFIPGFSASGSISGQLVTSTSFSDGKESDEAKFEEGSILILPLPSDLPTSAYDAYIFLRSQCLRASDRGAAAVIYVFNDTLPAMESAMRLTLPIPVIALSAEKLKKIPGFSSNPVTIPSEATAEIVTEVLPGIISTHNTIAALKGGKADVSDQYIIIGAHHDHLGMGGRGTSSRRQDTLAVHYGADDNASGVAGVIELSQYILSRSPDRSFLFTTFAAEEMGLYGSKMLAETPPVDLSQVQAMINLDMIGRLNEDRQLQIGGVGTSPVFRGLIDSLNRQYSFNIAFSEAGYGPSDHSSFYAKDIPVLFISTGAHTDYHTPADNPEKINFTGMQEVLCFISDIAIALADMPEKIEFTLSGPKKPSGSRGREGMVTFGLMPDVMYDGNEGMPVSFVTEGKPAAIGGMKSGDIITAVDGKGVGNVHDYMERLSDLQEGQSVIVKVKREGKEIELLLKL